MLVKKSIIAVHLSIIYFSSVSFCFSIHVHKPLGFNNFDYVYGQIFCAFVGFYMYRVLRKFVHII